MNGKRHGKGREEYKEKDAFFEGEFRKGLRHGYGSYSIKSSLTAEIIKELHCLPFLEKNDGVYEEKEKRTSNIYEEIERYFQNYGFCLTGVNEYEFNGEWKNDVKNGYGVEIFIVTMVAKQNTNWDKHLSAKEILKELLKGVIKDKDQPIETKEMIIYEGEFLNGKRNGVGRMAVVGKKYMYGPWLQGRKNGKFVEYDEKRNHTEDVLYVFDEKISSKTLRTNGMPSSYEDGHYQNVYAAFSGALKSKDKKFEDDQFPEESDQLKKFLELILDPQKKENIEKLTKVKMTRMSEIFHDFSLGEEDPLSQETGFGPRMPYFRFKKKGSQAFLLFLSRLLSFFPQILPSLLHPYTSFCHGIFSAYMFKHSGGLAQKFNMVVDDKIPMISAGKSLFNFSKKNCVQTYFLSLLEKCKDFRGFGFTLCFVFQQVGSSFYPLRKSI